MALEERGVYRGAPRNEVEQYVHDFLSAAYEATLIDYITFGDHTTSPFPALAS